MIYGLNKNMDFIPTDDTTTAIFDPESGDTYLLDETATDIVNALEEPCDLETLLLRLCEIYNASSDDIRDDVVEFLGDLTEKKIVITA